MDFNDLLTGYLGPLHTRAKGHDHEMVRALDYH